MSQFNKPALTLQQQIDLLIKRGMYINDRERTKHALMHIGYYRLRAYWSPFEIPALQPTDHLFQPGTDFDTVLSIYNFDRKLRLLLLDAIESMEVSLRSCLANELALRYSPFAHENTSDFRDPTIWQEAYDKLKKEYLHSRETFAAHYRKQYPQLSTPPIWVTGELMTLGHLSRWLKNLKSHQARQHIANNYNLDETVLVSFIHHLTVVRNHCAHHGRLWNRKFSFKMQIPNKKPAGLSAMFNRIEDKLLYNTLTMLAYLLKQIAPQSDWQQRVKQLIAITPAIDPTTMGFPIDWEQRTIWHDNITQIGRVTA